jgi:hypothetical protein
MPRFHQRHPDLAHPERHPVLYRRVDEAVPELVGTDSLA